MHKLITLIMAFACIAGVYSQTPTVEYEILYNVNTSLYEARLHVVGGSLTFPRTRSNPSSFSIVVPASVPDTPLVLTTVEPAGAIWVNNSNIYAPTADLTSDYRYVTKPGGGTYTTFNDGDNILLFTFSLGGSCVDGVRLYENGVDINNEDLGGGDFSNSLQNFIVGDLYAGNRNESFFFEQTSPGDWSDTNTWLDARIPTPYSNVRITHTGQSTISNQDYVVDNLELLGVGSELVVETGRTLGITRDVTNNGSFTGDGIVELIGPCGPQDLIGTGSYGKLIADNTDGVNVTESTVINGYLNVDNGIFTTNNATTFPCDFDNPTGAPFTRYAVGQVGPIAPTASISGDVTVEQCFPGRRAFRLVSASTTGGSMHNEWQENPNAYNDDPRPGYGTHITGLAPGAPNALDMIGMDQTNGLDWQPSGNVSVFSFNTDQTWADVTNTETTTLGAGDAYLMMIRGSRAVNLELNSSPTSDTKLESTGTALKGPVSVSPNVASGQLALVGNPFHAVVNLLNVIPTNGDYTNFAYIFDPNIGGSGDVNSTGQLGGRGGYVTINLSDGSTNLVDSGVTVSTTDASPFIQPYQAFFVQTNTASPANIVFEEADKAVGEIQTDVFSSLPQAKIFVNLFDKESLNNLGTPDDGVVIYFTPNANNAVDANDAPKFFNQDEMIARNENGSLMSFEYRDMPTEDDVLKLHTGQYRTTDYVLEVGVQYLPEQTAYLYDKYTDTETILENNESNLYDFTVDASNPASVATDRFKIIFRTTTMGTNEFDLQGISVYPNPASDILNIGFGENTGRFNSIELFDISGRLVAKQSVSNQLEQAQVDVNTFSSGVYLLKVSSESEQFTTKVIVE
jgi:hypothetical protein